MNDQPNSQPTAGTGASLRDSKLRHSKREQHDIDLETLNYQRQGYSCREIARKQGVHLNTVHDRIRRARDILREEIQESRDNWQDDQWWRIQQLQTAFWPQATEGDLQALWGVLRLMGETRRIMEKPVDSKRSYMTQGLFKGLLHESNATRFRVVKNLAEGKHPYANDHPWNNAPPPSPGLGPEVAPEVGQAVAPDAKQMKGYTLEAFFAKQREKSFARDFAHDQDQRRENSPQNSPENPRTEPLQNYPAEHGENYRAQPLQNPRAEQGENCPKKPRAEPAASEAQPLPTGYHPCPRLSSDPIERARQIAAAEAFAQRQAAWLHESKAKHKADLKRALELDAAREAERLKAREAQRAERQKVLEAQAAQAARQREADQAKDLARVGGDDHPTDVNPGGGANSCANSCANGCANGCANAKGPESREKPLSESQPAPPGPSTTAQVPPTEPPPPAAPEPPPMTPVLLLGTPPPASQSSGVQP